MKLFNRRLMGVSTLLLVLGIFVGWAGPSEAAMKKQVIYSFGGFPDGELPFAPVAADRNGVLYGTTYLGGTSLSGTVFSLAPPTSQGGSWTETVLHSFVGGSDGAGPKAGLLVGKDGTLYGTTQGGGSGVFGTVFSLAPPATAGGDWTETILYAFSGGADGSEPVAGLAAGKDGTLYGTTQYGGSGSLGTVFALTPPATAGASWTENILHSFLLSSGDGVEPLAGLVIGQDGTLYGTTPAGGAFGAGTIFSLTPPVTAGGTWSETVLYSFGAYTGDGTFPFANVVLDKYGVLYGTTTGGGAGGGSSPPSGCGTVFSLRPPATAGANWKETLVRSFARGADGCGPTGAVLIGKNGALFGATFGASAFSFPGDDGTLFALRPPPFLGLAWSEAILPFSGSPDGANPNGGLIAGKNGALYGTTFADGPGGLGAVFQVTR
jgi:uncharacterized repeat protein (TIGR03803 family)